MCDITPEEIINNFEEFIDATCDDNQIIDSYDYIGLVNSIANGDTYFFNFEK